jgi:hypothetical protein
LVIQSLGYNSMKRKVNTKVRCSTIKSNSTGYVNKNCLDACDFSTWVILQLGQNEKWKGLVKNIENVRRAQWVNKITFK